MKWCWARLPGGVVTWEAYQGFRVGEKGGLFHTGVFERLTDIYQIPDTLEIPSIPSFLSVSNPKHEYKS